MDLDLGCAVGGSILGVRLGPSCFWKAIPHSSSSLAAVHVGGASHCEAHDAD